MGTIQLIQVTPSELVDLFREASKVEIQVQIAKVLKLEQTEQNPKKYLTRKETAEQLQVSLVTIHKWQKLGILNVHKLGNRSYFLQEDIYNTLNNSRRA
jgi:hypothetical protein